MTRVTDRKDQQRETTTMEKSVPEKGNPRPTVYSHSLAKAVCERIATSENYLKQVCADESLPSYETVLDWLQNDREFRLSLLTAIEEPLYDLTSAAGVTSEEFEAAIAGEIGFNRKA